MFGTGIKDKASDLSLLQSAALGECEAFNVFVVRHQAAVFRFAQTLTSSTAQAEDVLQGTFVAAWRGAGGFTGEGSARSWLFTIARRSSGRMHRKRVGEPESYDDVATLGCDAGWGNDCQALAGTLENRDWVNNALARMNDADRELLLLIEVEGLTIEEAAETVGLSKAATKSRLHRARLLWVTALRKEHDIGK